MKYLGIRGSKKNPYLVIKILTDLGAVNSLNYEGSSTVDVYYIGYDNEQSPQICMALEENLVGTIIYDAETFCSKYPYHVGDEVYVKELDTDGVISHVFWNTLSGEIMYTIEINGKYYVYDVSNIFPANKTSNIKEDSIIMNDDNYCDKVELYLGDDYEIVNEDDGKTYIVKKAPKLPTTYFRCCKIMGIDPSRTFIYEELPFYYEITQYDNNLYELMNNLRSLIVCRDAYWKALNWKPDWDDAKQEKYIITTINNEISTSCVVYTGNFILAFPDVKSKNLFYDSFNGLIDKCKELL